MKNIPYRSLCPINFSLEMFGDTWSLLILRDIIYFNKKTYGEFLASDEKIARNILADRLLQLQQKGILIKNSHPTDKRKDIYELTEKGLDAIALLLELADWGSLHTTSSNFPKVWITTVRNRRDELIPLIRKTVKHGDAIFVGKKSVIKQLNLNIS